MVTAWIVNIQNANARAKLEGAAMIKVFGDRAKDIQDGDKFIAKITFVEGRKVVILEPVKAHTPEEALEIVREAFLNE